MIDSHAEDIAVKAKLRVLVPHLWPSIRPYRGRFLLGFLLILFSTGIEVASPLVIGKSVDAATARDTHFLWELCAAYFGLIVLRAFAEAFQAYVIQSTGQSVMHDLRALLFSKIEALPVAYFDRNPTGRLLTRVINDIKSLSELFTASMSVLVLDFMIIAATIATMFWMEWRLTFWTLLTFPLVLFAIRYFGNRLAAAYRGVRLRLAEINAFLGENIGAIATIQRLAGEKERFDKFSGIVQAHNSAQMESIGLYACVQPATNVLNGVSMGTLLAVGGYWAVEGRISVGMLVAFLGYLRNLFQPVRDLVEKYNNFLSAMVSAERVVGILNEKSEWETNGTRPVPADSGPVSIRFEGVDFHYPTRPSRALEKVTFSVPAGTSCAVVGATGSGKSTLIRLILRFYEPDEGTIWLGDRKLVDIDKVSLRRHVGVVHQEIYLFGGTVRENLTLGQGRFTDAFLQAQCERAQLWDFIRRRGGLDMHVEEGGTNVSLGERQLLSFARVLVFDSPVLILDEATSSVDRRLERRLMEAMKEILTGRTSIVIAHRLSTIRRCHSVLVLEKGHVMEQGTYEGVLKEHGVFAKFHEIHSRA